MNHLFCLGALYRDGLSTAPCSFPLLLNPFILHLLVCLLNLPTVVLQKYLKEELLTEKSWHVSLLIVHHPPKPVGRHRGSPPPSFPTSPSLCSASVWTWRFQSLSKLLQAFTPELGLAFRCLACNVKLYANFPSESFFPCSEEGKYIRRLPLTLSCPEMRETRFSSSAPNLDHSSAKDNFCIVSIFVHAFWF